MSNDLNKKYFETRQKHQESSSRRGYLIWTFIGIGLLAFFVGRSIIKNQRTLEIRERKTQEFMKLSTLTERDTLIIIKSIGTKILVLSNCLFKDLETNFASIKNDNSGLTCIVKRIVPDPDYSSSIGQWENQTKQTEPSYKFKNLTKDSTESKVVESADVELLSDDNSGMKGVVRIIRTGGLYYVTQVVAYEDYWDSLYPDIERILESIEIVE